MATGPNVDHNRVVIFGEYEIEGVLGRGSAGTVHRARRIHDGLVVALKRIPQLAGAHERDRLLAEGHALSRLHHPHILKFIEIVEDGDELGVVTELAERGTLASLLSQRGTLDPDQMVALLTPIADALAAAHNKGILHRDVKPSNVFLRQDGTPVLGDFGLAIDDIRTSQTTQTALGSAAYLDPDVLDGQPPAPSSDGYALGVMAYECLTGELPFLGDSTFAVLRAADRGVFVPLDRTSFGPLADQVERSFSRNRVDRFDSLADQAAAWKNPSAPAHVVPSRTPLLDGLRDTKDPLRETASFALPSRPRSLTDATPAGAPQLWKKRLAIGAAAVAAIGVLGGGATVLRGSGGEPAIGALVAERPDCDSQSTSQCVSSYQRSPNGIRVTFAGDVSPTQYRIGERSDTLRVANFFCGDVETLALYRPSTGIIYYFKSWPLVGERTEAVADNTGMLNAAIGVSDINDDGCADVALDLQGQRTWFSPAQQPDRLQPTSQQLGETEK